MPVYVCAGGAGGAGGASAVRIKYVFNGKRSRKINEVSHTHGISSQQGIQ